MNALKRSEMRRLSKCWRNKTRGNCKGARRLGQSILRVVNPRLRSCAEDALARMNKASDSHCRSVERPSVPVQAPNRRSVSYGDVSLSRVESCHALAIRVCERPLPGEHFDDRTVGSWPISDRFASPILPFSATNLGLSASGKSRPAPVLRDRPLYSNTIRDSSTVD